MDDRPPSDHEEQVREQPRPWYVEWFGVEYLELYEHRDRAEAARACELLVDAAHPRAGDRILDVACGSGRHAGWLARNGYRVSALDRSADLLRVARSERDGIGPPLHLVRGDMRHLPFDTCFHVVASFFTSIGYFEADVENLSVLKEMAGVLLPGGCLFIDYLNPTHVLAHLVGRDERKLGDMVVIQERCYDPVAGRIAKQITFRGGECEKRYVESLRIYDVAEMTAMLGQAGTSIERTFGDYEAGALSAASPRMILVARKP